MSPQAYGFLHERFARIGAISGAISVLDWDSQTMMPKGGAEARAEQLAVLSVLHHEAISADDFPDLLDRAEEETLSDWQSANLREMRRMHRHATAMDPGLVDAFSRATSECEHAWREARADDDFATVLPLLETVIDLVRDQAAAKADALEVAPYDALIDMYEPGGSSQKIDHLFVPLADRLPEILQRVLERQSESPTPVVPQGPFDAGRQKELAHRLMTTLGFEFEHGRVDVSAHPFCGGTSDDVRLTTRFDETDFTSAVMAVIHETGHAMYERGLPPEWRGQPVGTARGMAVHESQSLMFEMQACRDNGFIEFLAPLTKQVFGGEGADWGADNLHRLTTKVERGLIRVDADEVTYPLHVMLRYRLERALLDRSLAPADLPGAWREGMAELVGAAPPDDRDGCMQDIHWYAGAFGYFPTYTMGALAAAQLFQAAKRADPGIPEALSRGDFTGLLAWAREKVHRWGSYHTTDDLLQSATGAPLGEDAFLAHLEERYLG